MEIVDKRAGRSSASCRGLAGGLAGVRDRAVASAQNFACEESRADSDGSTQLYKAALLEDADSGRVLMSSNADMIWPPASMAKMMLLLVAQEQIDSGRFSRQ